MITLESLTPGLSLTGLDPTSIGSVIAVVPIADGAVQILYKTPDGVLKERLLNREMNLTFPSPQPSVPGPSRVTAKHSNSPSKPSALTSPFCSTR